MSIKNIFGPRFQKPEVIHHLTVQNRYSHQKNFSLLSHADRKAREFQERQLGMFHQKTTVRLTANQLNLLREIAREETLPELNPVQNEPQAEVIERAPSQEGSVETSSVVSEDAVKVDAISQETITAIQTYPTPVFNCTIS